MALTRTLRFAGISPTSPGTGTYSATSFTPAANSFLVVETYGVESSGASDPTPDFAVSGGSLTWVPQNSIGDAVPWSNGGKFFTAQVGGSPVSTTVTVGSGGLRNMLAYGLKVVEYSGHNVGSPIGATAQQAIVAAAGSNSLTLSGAPATDSDVLGLAGVVNGSATIGDGGAGYTELSDVYDATSTMGMESQARTASTSTTYTWANVATSSEKAVLLAIEIKAAAAPPPASPAKAQIIG